MKLDAKAVRRAVKRALAEDLGKAGDVTTLSLRSGLGRGRARIVAREPLVLAGIPVARAVFRKIDPSIVFEEIRSDGDRPGAGEAVAAVRGRAGGILEGERTALNFLMRMSGVATVTRAAVDEVAGTGVRILDTRKTMPGLRVLDKYATAVGGASNHRMGLYDAVMFKDTHLASGISITEAVERALARGHVPERITVEVRDLQQLAEAVAAGAGRALLDNMDVAELRAAVEQASGRIVLEASGGLRPGKLAEVAATGVDCMSLGWLTHSARAADLAMEMELRR